MAVLDTAILFSTDGMMFEHPVLNAIRTEGFVPLGWFEPATGDGVPEAARFVILIGNAGPHMFARFAHERAPDTQALDEWCRAVLDPLAQTLGGRAYYPFDAPPLPFLTWARRAGAAHRSPLGLNIHPDFGLWHAYRAALAFPVVFDFPAQHSTSPCESCAAKPCLSACPVEAFDGHAYAVETCTEHLASPAGLDCMTGGCLARRACPIGRRYAYDPPQAQFHMRAFLATRLAHRDNVGGIHG
ncbi:MAG: hypothetical protein M3N38_09275 [Pseudomonadota bacterium]|nr:hypothetical protein [Pseudomonadota bacterium]